MSPDTDTDPESEVAVRDSVDDRPVFDPSGAGRRYPAASAWTATPEAGSASLLGLAEALIDEHQIGVAVGIVAAQRQQTPREALDTLVGIAHRTDRSVVEVARHLVARHSYSRPATLRAVPSRDDDPGGPDTAA